MVLNVAVTTENGAISIKAIDNCWYYLFAAPESSIAFTAKELLEVLGWR